MPIHTLTSFSNVKSIAFCILELVHQVGEFTVSKGGDGREQVGVRACFAAHTIARMQSFQGGERGCRWRVDVDEDLAEVDGGLVPYKASCHNQQHSRGLCCYVITKI